MPRSPEQIAQRNSRREAKRHLAFTEKIEKIALEEKQKQINAKQIYNREERLMKERLRKKERKLEKKLLYEAEREQFQLNLKGMSELAKRESKKLTITFSGEQYSMKF
jgi:hypothetical protein